VALLPASKLERIEKELERIGLLFEHDREHPSFTGIAAGQPIAGSWWSHRLAHPIYDTIVVWSERPEVLWAKLVNGKVTYVHRRLWPAFFAVVLDARAERTAGLPDASLALLARVRKHGSVRLDELARAGVASARELTAAGKKLEARLLVQSDSVHTDSGAHARVLETWEHVIERRGLAVPKTLPAVTRARAELEAAARALTAASPRPTKLPW
jgi:hypothetical protein